MAEALVLALDTSTVVNVGLARGSQVLARVTIADRMAHVEQLTPAIRGCLSQGGVRLGHLDLIVVGLGPGPFTGLRVGVVTAQVLASVAAVPLRGVCSLDALAAEFAAQSPAGSFVVATDARRREVYWARYSRDGVRTVGPAVSAPADVPRDPTIGPGVNLYPDQLVTAPGPLGQCSIPGGHPPSPPWPRALDPGVLAVRGPDLPDAGREPLYLRRPDAAEPTRRKSVLGAR
jgi:tRNA threonylcarbamoyl adenosine modification protein YeaZ